MTPAEYIELHDAIHSNSPLTIIDGKLYQIDTHDNGCRYCNTDIGMFMEQNQNQSSSYAKMAREGRRITWILRSGLWGLIIDNEIVHK